MLPRNFEKLAEEAGLAKPLGRSRVPEFAELVIANPGKIEIVNTAARGVAELIMKRCERARE